MQDLLSIIGSDEGQDIAEYAVMLAVILVLVIGTIRLVGSNANNAFSAVAKLARSSSDCRDLGTIYSRITEEDLCARHYWKRLA
jgi:Flp pilus assembly pilin Flp